MRHSLCPIQEVVGLEADSAVLPGQWRSGELALGNEHKGLSDIALQSKSKFATAVGERGEVAKMAAKREPNRTMPNPSTSDGVVVWIPALLRDLTGGQETVRVQGGTVRQLIDALDQRYPGIKERLCAGDDLRPGVAVAVGSQVSALGLLQPVPEGSEVHFLPALSGG